MMMRMSGNPGDEAVRLRHFWFSLALWKRFLIILPVYVLCTALILGQWGSEMVVLCSAAAVFALTVTLPLILGRPGTILGLLVCLIAVAISSWYYRDFPSRGLTLLIASQIGAVVAVLVIHYVRAVNLRHLEDLSHLALTDGLTGLYNRRTFESRLEEEWARSARHGVPLALLITDVDEFKQINDRRGHYHGDLVLREFARILRETCRIDDSSYRIGGDEFAILLPETDVTGAEVAATRIREQVRKSPIMGKNRDLPVSISIGISAAPELAASAQELFLQADAALYQVKHTGRNGHHAFADAFERVAGGNGHDGDTLHRIKALLWAAASKDRYTYGHSERVGEYAVKIAQALGLSPTFVERLRLAGLVYEVGVSRIDRSILTKDGPLKDEEWEAVKRHPADGAEIVSKIDESGEIGRCVLHHHEHFDGTGYPEGLKGSQIPLGARILAIADAFDAMTTSRPFRPGFDRDQAYAELRKAAGSHFDPALVPKAIEVFAADRALN